MKKLITSILNISEYFWKIIITILVTVNTIILVHPEIIDNQSIYYGIKILAIGLSVCIIIYGVCKGILE